MLVNHSIDCKVKSLDSKMVLVEIIPPADGKKEDKIVLSCIVAVVLTASSLLFWLYPPKSNHKPTIPQGMHAHLTSLANATDEILMMSEMGEKFPSLSELVNFDIAPFTQQNIGNLSVVSWQQVDHCFIGETHINQVDYQMRLIVGDTSGASIAWRVAQPDTLEELCSVQANKTWHTLNSTSNNQLHSH